MSVSQYVNCLSAVVAGVHVKSVSISYFISSIDIKEAVSIADVSQGRSGADGARGMPGETGSKVRLSITRPAAQHFNLFDDYGHANPGCALTFRSSRAGRQRIRRTPGAAWREGTQGES